jgi:hypothetical protein
MTLQLRPNSDSQTPKFIQALKLTGSILHIVE